MPFNLRGFVDIFVMYDKFRGLKALYWILLSLILHVVVAAVVLNTDYRESSAFSEDVVDLTLSSPTASLSNAPEQGKSAPKAKAVSVSDKASASVDASSVKEANDVSPEGQEGVVSGSGGDADTETVGWSQVSRFPKVKKEVKASYPEEAKKARVDGPVNLEVLIDRKGVVREVKVLSGPGFGLNESAIEALKQFEFQPARRGDEPVAVKIRYTYRFKLGVN
ncbi:Gram-negative bacterial tonB protein [compost metagenome]